MGTTSQKLTYLSETKSQLKDMINYGLDTGEKITSETTFRNYVKSLFDAFIKTMTYPDVLYNNLPKVTGEGTSVTLNDTVYAPMKVELSPSELEQATTTGKNLLPNNSFTLTKGSNRTITISLDNPIPEGTYTISCKITNKSGLTTSAGMGLQLFDSSVSPSVNRTSFTQIVSSTTSSYSNTRTIDGSATYLYCYLQTSLDDSATITIEDLQLEAGSTATSYEPYTYGASPNPDYPQQIHTVSGENEVKVEGKNLLPTTLYHLALNASGDTVGLIVGNANRNAYYCKIEPNTTYYISRGSVGTATYWYYAFTDVKPTGGVQSLSFANMSSDLSTQVTSPNNAKYICVFMGGGLSNNVMVSSSSDTTYEPYQSQTYQVNLGELELCKIGDYQDYLYKENGVWYKYGAIGKVVLDGSDTGIQSISSYDQVLSYTGEGISFQASFSNLLTAKSLTEHLAISNYFNKAILNDRITKTNIIYSYVDGVLRIATNITNKPDFKTWLSTHNTTVYYVLATPTYTKIEGTLASQLETVWKANSYKEQTNVSQENEDLPFVIKLSAIEDLSGIFEEI